jgi:serine/threonine-protein kinase
VLYELLTGRPPFQGDSPVAIAYQHVREEAPPPSRLEPSIPQWADSIAMKALAKDPNHRYQSASDMRADLQRASQGMPVSAPTMAMDAGTQVMRGGPPTQGTRPATMGYDLPPVEYAESGRPEGRGKQVAVWALVGLLAVGAVFALYMIFSNGGGGSPGASQVAIPSDIVGSDQDSAKQELVALGIPETNIQLKNQTDSNVEKGRVIAVTPAAKTKIDRARLATTQVTLTVSTGKPKVRVPSVKGKSEDQARSRIESAKLKVGPTQKQSSLSVPKGIAIGTSPDVGSRVEEGSEVILLVSDGPGKTLVPSEVGKPLDQARADLRQHGFKVNVRYVDSQPDQADDTVISQNPNDGDTANKGSTVTLTVARAQQQQSPPPNPFPSFTQ